MAFKDEMLEMPLIQFVLKVERGKKLLELKNMVLDSQEKLLKYLRLWTQGYIVSVLSTTSFHLFITIHEMITKEDSSLRLLAFDMWFPWSLDKMSVYVPSFIFQAYAGYLSSVAYSGFQMTIILLLCQVIRQLRILTFIMTNLNDLAIDIVEDKQDMWQVYCTSILIQCVDHYIKLKRFSNRLNVICQPFYLSLILAGIMLVCMCSVQIAILDKFSPGTIKFYAHALCFIVVVLMFSLLGEQVDKECGYLELAVTENWYIFDHKHKMNVSIFKMAVSQRMPIFIFGSVTLSSPTFTWFLKTGMSFFTLMMSFLEEA